MKNILFLALDFPEIGKSNNLYTDLMEEFRDNGHMVHVIASALENGNRGLSSESGITVLRTNTLAHQNVSLIRKGIANLLLAKQYLTAIKKYFSDISFDMIILPTPPITLVNVVEKIKKESGTPTYLILRDIFPQNAVDLDMIKPNGFLHRYFRKKEKKLYNLVDKIGCMSKANIDYISKYNSQLDPRKLHILRNWQREQEFTKISEKRKFNLENKFVILFGGNIGKPQKVENIINLAKLYQEDKNIVFYIIGKGTEMKKLKSLVSKNKLENFIIKDFLPRYEYHQLISVVDVGLVSLDERFTIPNLPSKAHSYFNAKIPVIALIDENTDFGTWIEDEIKCGYWAKTTEPELLKKKLDVIIENIEMRIKMGNNGYEYFVKYLNPNVAYKTIINTMKDDL